MMAGVITTGSIPQAIWPGINTFYGQEYAQYPKEYEALYDIQTSDKAYEKDVGVTGFGLAPVKPQGSSVSYDTQFQGYTTTYNHIPYALGYIVTHEEIRDNLYEQVSRGRVKGLAYSINQTIENLAAFLYNNAFNSTYFSTPDGQPIVSTAHVSSTGTTFSNALNPSADLSEGSLEDLCIQIAGFQDDRGLLIKAMPRTLHIARQEWFNANRILKSVQQSGNANNDINALKATNAIPGGIHVNHYFTSPHAWFLRTDVPHGMRMFWRDKPEFRRDNDFDTMNDKSHTYFRVSFGVTDVRGISGSNGP